MCQLFDIVHPSTSTPVQEALMRILLMLGAHLARLTLDSTKEHWVISTERNVNCEKNTNHEWISVQAGFYHIVE